MSAADRFAISAVVLLWGLNFVAVKIAAGYLPPFLITSLRFFGVALALAPFFRLRRAQLPGVAAFAAVLGVGHFGLLFFGISGMDAATTAIVTQLGVPFSALLAWIVFGERLGLARGAGLAFAFAGVMVLAGEPHLPSLLPFAAAVAAMLAWALSNIQVKRLGAIDPLALNGWMAAFAAPMLLVVSLAAESGQADALVRSAGEWRLWAAMAYTVVGSSLVAYTLWYRLIARHPVNKVVPMLMLSPLIGIAAGVLVLGEPLTWQKLVGGALVIAGVALVQIIGGAAPSPVEPEPGA
ncbi:DMT family transporter [Magnetospirillum sp. UT-4]|uniref:DMT family transporter n=1 Tax=Magnetospirillum sp. UT-4 TaxID=2681467 RepID=UPI001381CF7E|nr:EamA family transporter [Magnetospirillum sp. UT-4]CAA7623235.1 Integral membrane protein [Magnetospirillum sp. UT-4]